MTRGLPKLLILLLAIVIIFSGTFFVFKYKKYFIPADFLSKALQEKRIEFKKSNDWNKYFVFLPKQQVDKLLTEAEDKGRFKYLFPQFDVTKTTNLIIENREIPVPDLNTSLDSIQVKNLIPGTKLYSNFNGSIQIGVLIGQNSTTFISGKEKENNFFILSPHTKGESKVLAGKYSDKEYPVSLSDPLLELKNNSFLDETHYPGKWQFVFYIERKMTNGKSDFSVAGFENLLTQNNKIVMIKL
jgi:hypothetical protein